MKLISCGCVVQNGGGVYSINSDLSFKNCKIIKSYAENGGGLFSENSSIYMIDGDISSNTY